MNSAVPAAMSAPGTQPVGRDFASPKVLVGVLMATLATRAKSSAHELATVSRVVARTKEFVSTTGPASARTTSSVQNVSTPATASPKALNVPVMATVIYAASASATAMLQQVSSPVMIAPVAGRVSTAPTTPVAASIAAPPIHETP